ncbi:hypothetical protein, partial [Mesorhizobium sp.]|uniref:hypothetical protein n=1 Tax=Mesorhizobium sp. TaxID=1871066 RepID=UPI0025BEF759
LILADFSPQRNRETARAKRQTLAAFVPSKFAPGHRDRRVEAAARMAAVSWGEFLLLGKIHRLVTLIKSK